METWNHEEINMRNGNMEKYRHADMNMQTSICRHRHGEINMETWKWRHGHADMTWRHGHVDIELKYLEILTFLEKKLVFFEGK